MACSISAPVNLSQFERMTVDLDGLAWVAAHPFPRYLFDQLEPFLAIRQRERAPRRQMLEFRGQGDLVTDQRHGACTSIVVLRNILEESNQRRILQVRMKIQQRINTSDIRGADVLQNLHGLGEVALGRSDVDIEALDTVGDRPLKERQTAGAIGGGCGGHSRRAGLVRARPHQALEDLFLIAGFHHDERDPRANQDFEICALHDASRLANPDRRRLWSASPKSGPGLRTGRDGHEPSESILTLDDDIVML